jgi:hypothetical protein
LHSLVVLVLGFGLAFQASAATPDQTKYIEIDPRKPQDHWLAAGATGLLAPEAPHGLSEIAPGNIGWFDYDFSVDQQGWYRLLIEASSHVSRTDFLFDPANPTSQTRLVGATPIGNGRYQGGWVWLTSGPHRLRVQQFFWTGFPRIGRLQLEAPPPDESLVFRVVPPAKTVFAIGSCAPLTIETGGNTAAFTVNVAFSSKGRPVAERQFKVPPSQGLTRHSVGLPCDMVGDLSADLRSTDARADLNVKAQVSYSVFDTSPVEPSFLRGRLAIDIDAANRQPDFQAGDTSVTTGPAGVYRSSGTHGSTTFSRRTGGTASFVRQLAARTLTDAPDWFAYRVAGLLPNQPYILEVEYPDDASRVFVVALRDSKGRGYPTSIGAETGEIWPLSGGMARMSAVVWPSSSEGRVIVFNIHDGMRAAIGRIRIYEAIFQQSKQTTAPVGGREVMFWHEEGDNFRDVVGEGHEPAAVFTPVDRYLGLARSAGATVVSPTVAVYNFAMYPSRFHLTFDDGGRDMTAAFMLGAERYGLKIVPQLHPRADELVWPPRDKASFDKRLLLSANGAQHLLRPDGDMFRPPYYNPLNADVENWYLEMIGELADRYKDYPAFAGINLRLSSWQNPALNNLVSLEWGYDADTVARFFRETRLSPRAGLDVTTDAPESVRLRRDYLVGKHRSAWIAWRCEKIRDLYRNAVLRVRSVRPDLKLSVSIFGDRTWNPEAMREFGIDIDLLKAIDGLTLVDERFGHGAREAEPSLRRVNHADLMSAEHFIPFAGPDSRPHVLLPMEYIEITGQVAPSRALGLPAPPKEAWISSATEPPGRLALARFATIVGVTDPFMIGDGGNGYVFGNENLREFMTEFRSLPRYRFERVAGTPDTIVVRQYKGIFYIVNMLGVPISARVRLDASGVVKRTTSGEVMTSNDGILQLDLLPYQMAVFETEDTRRVLEAQAILGKEAELGFAARATVVRKAADAECGGFIWKDRCSKVRARSHEIEAAISQSAYWTAERLLWGAEK